jgi:hypothetical protein
MSNFEKLTQNTEKNFICDDKKNYGLIMKKKFSNL